ncbi:MAG: helix-turn-helix domain-containing protein [Candidatus Anammoxibacter sp.]
MEDIIKKLGARIREERRKIKFTQEGLAKRTDLSVDFIGYIERGNRSPGIKTLERIAKALNVETYELFIFEKNKKAKDNEAAIKKLILSLDNKKPEYMKFMSSIMKQVFERMEVKKV